jgi:hypothetical protein
MKCLHGSIRGGQHAAAAAAFTYGANVSSAGIVPLSATLAITDDDTRRRRFSGGDGTGSL